MGKERGQEKIIDKLPGWRITAMPRQVRIEFPAATYHVMCRGDRPEDIFRDDGDREMMLATYFLLDCFRTESSAGAVSEGACPSHNG